MTLPSSEVDWARAKAILGDVLDAPLDTRAAELERQCDGDELLRAAVGKLLAALDEGTAFLAEPVAEEPTPEPHPPGERIGQYQIVRELGRGGMGTVFEAVQDRPRRQVALKLLHASISSDRITERFVREAELLARLDHPNIARVYEAGTHHYGHRGTPYFAMEFIEDALPITKYAEEMSLSERARVELFLPVCDAVHFGHQRGIIHRDLKPGNILVGGDKRPRVIDFGVARTTGADQSLAALDTAAHEIIGTLRYMSPEQCSGNANEVDVRCDVYALGVVLYETLVGRLPYEFKSTSLLEIPRVITEMPPRRLGPPHDSDLETIVLKALEKSRDRRYQSVSELASDLRRYLDGEPIEAKHDRKWYVLRKTLQRYRATVAVVATFFVLVAAAAIALGVLYARAERDAQNLRRAGYFQTIALAENALESSRTDELRRLLESCPADLRGWEWRYLSNRIDESLVTLDVSPYVRAALSPNGKLLANGTRDGTVEIWDLTRRERVAEHAIGVSFVDSMSFSPDGRRIALGTRASTPSYVIDTHTGEILLELPASEQVKSVLMLPDGNRLATGSASGELVLRDLDSGAVVEEFTDSGQWVTALALSPDGTTLASGRNNGKIETWDVETGELGFGIDGAHAERVSGLVFAIDSSRLFSAGWDAALKMWDEEGQQLDVRETQGDLVRGLAMSPAGDLLAAATTTTTELRDTRDGTLVRSVLGQSNVYGVAFPPEASSGDQLVTWSDRAVKIWDLDAGRGADILGRHRDMSDSVATSPDGQWIASAGRRGSIVLWDAKTGTSAAKWAVGAARVFRLEFNPQASLLAGACDDGVVRVWSIPDGTLKREFAAGQRVLHAQWYSDDIVLAASQGGRLSAWSVRGRQLVWDLETEQGGLDSVACSPRGDRVATGGDDGTIKIWKLDPPTLVRIVRAHEGSVSDLAWSPDGTLLASGGADRAVRLWGADNGRPRAEMVGHNGLIKGVDFSADGTRVATSAWEGEIRLWETVDGTCVLRLRGHVGVVMDVAFTADGQRLISAGNDGTVRIWEAPS